jgi:autophagy-related protein 33
MEASYEVLGDAHSDGTGSASGDEHEEEILNGEQVRGEVEGFLNTQIVQTVIATAGFLLAVIGIWGDGAVHIYSSETVVVGV